ncbi:MAG TPA: hypothetical protein PLM75_07760 [bacterium]|nr:hypothetical protein [bacterium]
MLKKIKTEIILFFFIVVFIIFRLYALLNDDVIYQGISWLTCNYQSDFPLWNYNLIAGFSNIASISMMTFHPLVLLVRFGIFTPENFFVFLMALYLFLAFAGMYFWIFQKTENRYSAIISAILFTFGGFTANCVFKGHYMLLGSYCFYPFIFLLCDKLLQKNEKIFRFDFAELFFILIFSLQILAGHPQQVYYQVIVLFPYILFANKNNVKLKIFISLKVFLLCLFSAALCAAQLLPTYNFSKEAARPIGAAIEIAQQYSTSLNHLIQIIFPFFWGRSATNNFFLASFEDYSQYLGICSVILLVIAIILFFKNKFSVELWFWFAIFIISFLLALGQYFSLFEIFYNCLPAFKMFRGPIRLFSINLFALSVIIGFVIKFLIDVRKDNVIITILIFFVFLTLILLIFCRPLIEYFSQINSNSSFIKNLNAALNTEKMHIMINAMKSQLFIALLFELMLLIFLKFQLKLLVNAIVIIFLAEFLFFFNSVLPEKKRIEYFKPNINSAVYKYILSDTDFFRIKYYENQLNINKNLYIHNLRNIDGYTNIIPLNTALLECYINEKDEINKIIKSNRIFIENIDSYKFSLTNVKYLVSSQKLDNLKNWEFILSDNVEYLYKNKCFLPVFLLCGR